MASEGREALRHRFTVALAYDIHVAVCHMTAAHPGEGGQETSEVFIVHHADLWPFFLPATIVGTDKRVRPLSASLAYACWVDYDDVYWKRIQGSFPDIFSRRQYPAASGKNASFEAA
ncbi:MAG: hypothetical protein JO249_04745 [Acidobacteria bacterium]|nr:hypothetical protein [Acidobacteriota bacterium]